jgi:hypothetical protein
MHSRTILRKRVLFFLVSSLIALFALNQTSHAQISGTWELIGTHPQAAAQPATIGGQPTFAQYLWSLKAWNEHLYAGYGDYGANGVSAIGTQFAVTPFDPKTGSFASPVFQFNAEAVPLYRDLAGRLFAPNMDASDGGRSPRNFAFGSKSGVWTEHIERPAFHIFDVATLNLTDVWMVGSDCVVGNDGTDCTKSDAVVWRSTDGGNTFQESLRVHPPEGFGVARFYFAGVLNNHLYVQQADTSATTTTAQSHSLVFDGSTWSDGPNLFPRRDLDPTAYGYQPTYFKGKMVYMTKFSFPQSNHRLVAFDGVSASYVDLPQQIFNFTVDGSYIYVLLGDGLVRRTSDLSLPWAQWEVFSAFPVLDQANANQTAGRSIALLNGKIYIGDRNAKLYRYSTTLNVIDDQRFFVEQQYKDFLERESDPAGLDYWTSQITPCGSNATCLDQKRIDVARAFWYAPEFLQKHSGLRNPPGVSPDFDNREFVRLCYVIYLQRDPDQAGWDHWTNDLDNDIANGVGYDHLIKAFLVSPEYRGRFGG